MIPEQTAAHRAAAATDAGHLLGRVERVPLSRFHLRVASILGVGTFFDSFDAQILSVALTAIVVSLHAPMSVAGVLIAAGYAGQILGAIAFGFVSERAGRKVAFIAASVLFGLLALASAAAWNVESLMVFRFVQGIGLGAEVPVAAAMFNEFVRAKARGRIGLVYESLFVWGILGASLVGALFLSAFPPAHAWRYLFVLGGVPLLGALWAAFRLPESPRHLVHRGDLARADAVVSEMEASARKPLPEPSPVPDAAGEPPTRFGELFSRAYRGRTAVVWLLWFTTYLPLGGFTSWMPTMLGTVGHLPASTASLLSALMVVGNLVACYLAASTLDRLGRRFWFIAGYAIAIAGGVAGAVLIGVLGMHGWQTLFACGAVVLFGVNVNAPIAYLYTAELYPTRMRAWATMVGSTMRNLAWAIAPITIGVLLGGAAGVQWSFVLAAVVLAVGLVMVLRYGIETKRRPLEELAR